jgi:hypothetical protein
MKPLRRITSYMIAGSETNCVNVVDVRALDGPYRLCCMHIT